MRVFPFMSRTSFAIGNRKSKIANVIVPVVQRIERRFPNSKGPLRQQLTKQIRGYPKSSLVLPNPPIFLD